MKTETYTCQHCGTDVVRPVVRGQRPRWCADCRSRSVWQLQAFTCEGCGKATTGVGRRFCSVTCSNRAKPARPRKPKPPKRDLRSDIRAGYEDRDWGRLLDGIRSHVECTPDGCWVWQRRLDKSGYPIAVIDGRNFYVHRLTLMAKHGADLGTQAAHHTCANTACVGPDHLMPVTHRENVAEMLARHSYLRRIRELEAALVEVDATHPLLAVIPVA